MTLFLQLAQAFFTVGAGTEHEKFKLTDNKNNCMSHVAK